MLPNAEHIVLSHRLAFHELYCSILVARMMDRTTPIIQLQALDRRREQIAEAVLELAPATNVPHVVYVGAWSES